MIVLLWFLLLVGNIVHLVNATECSNTISNTTSSTLNTTSILRCDQIPIIPLFGGFLIGGCTIINGVLVHRFLGVPYAAAPIGKRRFMPPEPFDRTLIQYNATTFGLFCAQQPTQGNGTSLHLGESEDCLTLNIWRPIKYPAKPLFQKLAVMVWIHGGLFQYGTANSPYYDGSYLASVGDVCVVSINYRLSVYGFLCQPSIGVDGNMGLLDQLMALQWIRDNIAKFGCDPNQVTLMGESSGSMSVTAQILSPLSKGYFHRAIASSGCITDLDRWQQPNLFPDLLERTGCANDDPAKVLECLQAFDFKNFPDLIRFFFWPCVDHYFFTDAPEEMLKNPASSNMDLLFGVVKNEGTLAARTRHPEIEDLANVNLNSFQGMMNETFGNNTTYYLDNYPPPSEYPEDLRQTYALAVGDVILTCQTFMCLHEYVKYNGNGNYFAYYMTRQPTVSILPTNSFANGPTWHGVLHTDDIIYYFGDCFRNVPLYTEEDRIFCLEIMRIWTNFAKYGKPQTKYLLCWKPFSREADGSVKMIAYNLNLKSLTTPQLECERLEFCRNVWPYPLDKPYFEPISELESA